MELSVKAEQDWRNLGEISDLEEKGRHVLKIDGRQIAIFQSEDGLFAINNRCPHEGYPLVEGTLNDSCVLACNWHGWAFDLKTGKAMQGRDPVRTYPIERRGPDIWIDMTPPPADLLAKRAYTELDEALAEHDYARIARSLCRLEKNGVELEKVAERVISWSLPRFERGFGHAHAGLADWAALAGRDSDLRLVAYLEAIGHFAWDGVFSPPLEIPDDALEWDEQAYIGDLEAMRGADAMRRINGAFKRGLGFANIKPVMLDFIFSHYAGFGHPAIYTAKLGELTRLLGSGVEQTLALQLTQYLCIAAREDMIPEFRGFADYLEVKGGDATVPAPSDFSGQSVRNAMALTAASLEKPAQLFDSLLGACAMNMLCFDDSLQHKIEQPIAQNVGWLDFTHALTFAEAFRGHAVADARYWQSGLMQMACFVGRNSRYLVPQDWTKWRVADKAQFLAEEKAALFNMDAGEYIYGVHRLKSVVALERLAKISSAETRELLFAAVNRFLQGYVRQHHPARTAFQARESVSHEG